MTELGAERGSGRALWKTALIFAILPAIIAGIFSVLPKIYEELSKNKPELLYSINSGPQISQDGENKKIYNVIVRNSGNEVAKNVSLSIASSGKIEAVSGQKTRGLDNTFIKKEFSTETEIKSLFPKDFYALSILVSSVSEIDNPKVTLRSDEMIGDEIVSGDKNETTNSSIISFLFAGVTTLLTMVVYILVLTRFRNKIPRLYNRFYSLSGPDRNGIISSISYKTQNEFLIDKFGVLRFTITYWEFANIIVYLLKTKGITQDIALKSLQALTINSSINENSKLHIINCINNIDQNFIKEIAEKLGSPEKVDIVSFNNYLDSLFSLK